MKNIQKVGKRSKNITTKVQKPFCKAEKKVYLLILANLYAPRSGYAYLKRIRIHSTHPNQCGAMKIRIQIQIRNSKDTWSARLYCSLWRRQRHLSDSISTLSGSMLKVKKKLSQFFRPFLNNLLLWYFKSLRRIRCNQQTEYQYVFGPPGSRSVVILYPSIWTSNPDFSHFFTSFFTFLSMKTDVNVWYFQQVISKNWKKTCQPLTKKVGSGAGSGSVSQWHGSADPADLDPYQNVTDPQHCRKGKKLSA
jgi:hypothetical protein